MPKYNHLVTGSFGVFTKSFESICGSDDAALFHALKHSDHNTVSEVWEGRRYVGGLVNVDMKAPFDRTDQTSQLDGR